MDMVKTADLITAIITPFNADATAINYEALEHLTNRLLATGTNGFVIGGTTGETPTLTTAEKLELYTRFAKIVAGRAMIIAGCGSNNTQATIDFTRQVAQIPGIDYALEVVPYYNKPNQRGMVAHFKAIAATAGLPIIIYNIPGRTGVTMTKETVVELAQVANVAGIKQCGSLSDLEYIVEHAPQDFLVYTGEDAQALFAKVIGATGVVSVASHLYGDQMAAMYHSLETGHVQHAGALQRQLTPKMAALFMYPSPAPVKAVLNDRGYQVGGCRLPIQTLTADEKARLYQALGDKEEVQE
ncbi:dihydrodipicolinate synthase [Levilactobacillus acidifarinae DSM 19394]|uniref:4-hydroxy-tetrahydrodipicolinate synthase n=2 Tax=Levilactobacillus acidifarinae TaxID=267364 RepID=A0A0R1LIG6_9LACO|nr:dihydrodipicolinate synthase [Levilactobacillus acidifarinae DSM 19394]